MKNRRQATIVSCSYGGCKFIAEVQDPNEAPEGWLMIIPALPDHKLGHSYTRSESFEFHSLRCVERWAAERRKYLDSQPDVQPGVAAPTAPPLAPPPAKGYVSGGRLLDTEVLEAIRLIIDTGEEPVTVSCVADLLGRPKATVKGHMRKLYEEGRVVKIGTLPGPGAPAVLYGLPAQNGAGA